MQTAYGEMTVSELVRYTEMWKAMMAKHNQTKNKYNQTDEGKAKNRQKAKEYYESHRQEILEKRRKARDEKKSEPLFVE